MRVVRARVLILLTLVYCALLILLYQFVWHSHRNDTDGTGDLFDSPGEDDLPRIGDDIVQFNFKRRNGPPLHESNETFDAFNNSFAGDDQLNSSLVPSFQVPVLEKPNIPILNLNNRADDGLTNSSVGSDEGAPPPHRPKQSGRVGDTLYDVSHLDPPNYCIHAFYYMWYGSPEFDGRYLHWNHRYLPHWQQSVTNQHPKGRHVPPNDIGASFYPG